MTARRPIRIRPALEVDEWATRQRCFGRREVVEVLPCADGPRVRVSTPDETLDVSGGDELAALIALANCALSDDDPRKLSRRYVTLLRDVAHDRSAPSGDASQAVVELLRQLANVIESYLPEREALDSNEAVRDE
jgi:hypothetical protein